MPYGPQSDLRPYGRAGVPVDHYGQPLRPSSAYTGPTGHIVWTDRHGNPIDPDAPKLHDEGPGL